MPEDIPKVFGFFHGNRWLVSTFTTKEAAEATMSNYLRENKRCKNAWVEDLTPRVDPIDFEGGRFKV